MSAKLRVVAFGNDGYTLSSMKRLIELTIAAKVDSEYHAICPLAPTTPTKDFPCKVYQQFIKDSGGILRAKRFGGQWKGLHTYLKELKPDYGVFFGFPSYDPNILKHFTKNIFLAQPSLLPNYAGPDAVSHALLNDDPKTGITLTQLTPDSDLYRGGILYQEETVISQIDNYPSLCDRLGHATGTQLCHILSDFEKGTTWPIRVQEKPPLVCESINRAFAIDQESAERISKLHRALNYSNSPPITLMRHDDDFSIASLISPSLDGHPNILTLFLI